MLANFCVDQAEGLRRMLAGPKPRLLSLFSVLPEVDKSATLINLAASLVGTGNSVLLLDAQAHAAGVSGRIKGAPRTSLAQMARDQRPLDDALHISATGFQLAVLALPQHVDQDQIQRVNHAFDALALQNDLVLVDADLSEDNRLPLAALASSQLVVQVSTAAADITAGYALIKRLSIAFGRQEIGVLVSGATEKQAQLVFHNMAQAASRYLALDLHDIGSVPVDEHINRASRLGRSVIDAFPLAGSSIAFRRLAGRLTLTELPLGKRSGLGKLSSLSSGAH
ncbi:MAG: antiactivator of flagellar biosynthesis FleN protein [Herbaspirillum sp.]